MSSSKFNFWQEYVSKAIQLPENSFLSETSQPFQIGNKITISFGMM